ncbi:MAG TPA: YbaN family protein [Candidatus Scybalomonas excrementigallinarum]|nr:YbaN family protein [Candidatus Scybalomonas excrementigallinarum]
MKLIYILLGCLSLGLGALGVALPLLPSFPFLLFAGFCFAKSSKRLHTWFVNTKLYKNNLESYVRGKGMTKKTKIRIMLFVTITMGIGFFMMDQVPVGRVILSIVWLFHIYYFVCKVKTMEAEA